MRILVLDTIHGGKIIGDAFAEKGHSVETIDVYRGTIAEQDRAAGSMYDLIVAPVHLDPDHPLIRNTKTPVITHHEAVRMLLGDQVPSPMVEITGSRGKTTTAHALASILPGRGILHTSTGTYSFPEKKLLWKASITPASVLPAAKAAFEMNGWLVAEESLGVSGAGDLAIITSDKDYSFAGGKKYALAEKLGTTRNAKKLLLAGGIKTSHPDAFHIGEIVQCVGIVCRAEHEGMRLSFTNPLLSVPPYKTALPLAAAAAMILHINPTPLSMFPALSGRMSSRHEGNLVIIDNSNSGANADTAVCAARYARQCAGTTDLTLVIGQAAGDGAVCEGFSPEQITGAIERIQPNHVVWVGEFPGPDTILSRRIRNNIDAVCPTLDAGKQKAILIAEKGSIVLAVKTWR